LAWRGAEKGLYSEGIKKVMSFYFISVGASLGMKKIKTDKEKDGYA
jgi:hypothetical protein